MRTHPLDFTPGELPFSAADLTIRRASMAMHCASLALLSALLLVIKVNKLKRSDILLSVSCVFARSLVLGHGL